MKESPKLKLKTTDPADWFRHARYAGNYKAVCRVAHKMTDGKCTLCDQPSEALHHAQYHSHRQWLSDVWHLWRGREINPPLPQWQPPSKDEPIPKLGGLTQGREKPGWSAFSCCSNCHDHLIHSSRHWKTYSNRERACWHNQNRLWMLWWLRLNWRLNRERRGLTDHGWLWRVLLWSAVVIWWGVGKVLRLG